MQKYTIRKLEPAYEEREMLMNSENFIEQKSLRDECVGRVEVLEKVKGLLLIPYFECMTIKQIADYYEVDNKAIEMCYARHKEEIDSDGISRLTPRDVRNLKPTVSGVKNFEQLNGKAVVEFDDGIRFVIPNRGVTTFPKRAIMRFGMLLRDSRVAQELRTQLLNVVEHAEETDPEILTAEINEEQRLQIAVGQALMNGNSEEVVKAMSEIVAYKNRHIDKLKEANERAETDNKALAGEILRITSRKELVRSVRCMSSRLKKTIPATWNILYKQLLYKFSISLANRKAADIRGKHKKLLDYIRPDEWRKVQMTISAILKENKISPTQFYDEVFGQYYIKTREDS